MTEEESNRRLLLVAKRLDHVPGRRFNFRKWVGEKWKGKPDLSCGTTACAVGWATTIPEFRKLGLRLEFADDDRFNNALVYKMRGPAGRQTAYDISAAALFFGLTTTDAVFLFVPKDPYAHRPGAVLPPTAGPRQVAKYIRAFVEKRQAARELLDHVYADND